MRYKFFNTVIHRGWRDGGKRHEEREGLGAVLAPFWFILKDSVAISATVTQNKKCLKKINIFFARIQLAKVETVAFLHTKPLPKNSSQSATLAEMAIRKISMVSHPHDLCETGCPIPLWDANSRVNAALLQYHILSPNSEKSRGLGHCLC